MSSKLILTPQKLKSLRKSFKDPKNMSDIKEIEKFNKITDKTLKETVKQNIIAKIWAIVLFL